MKTKGDFRSVALFVLLVAVTVFTFEIQIGSAGSIPLPPNINIVPPSADTPKEIAAFSGKWTGSWWSEKNQRRGEVILIIEEIDPVKQKAKVVYAWGPLVDPRYALKEGHARIEDAECTAKGGQAILCFRARGDDLSFFMIDGKLHGERRAPGGGGKEGGLRWNITMKPFK